ncbi:uncharacterized protein LOC125227160 [Leguminivora glycinivorella]|uniref:uncharacterized protein LOC125227160 n=1 Tax=Leguminivora glycinivorella TaxID=1035111 RepID=UPI00200F77F9|nr:uncharacterized protein LOC125227160 [Leguminivora glycinivorella]
MLAAEVNNDRTILDYLNEDCWRAVLQYVPVQDLIRTERASRQWQAVLLTYLRGIHITIVERGEVHHNTLKLTLSEDTIESFEIWTQKLGSSVVDTYCNSLESLAIIKENCPNINALKLQFSESPAPEQLLPFNLRENFKFVQQVYFSCYNISDPCVSEFLADRALQELEFYSCHAMTGLCFNTINLSNLKSLVIDYCRIMEPKYILPVIDRLGELTKLKVATVPYEILEEMQMVLDKMPKLEWLELFDDLRMSCHTSEPLSRLTRLKHLKISCQLGDCDVEAVTRNCQELTTLDLPDCQGMTSESVEPLCRNLGARLTSLYLGTFYEAEDDDVVAIIRGCPQLTLLFIGGSGSLTPALPARAAAARRAASPGRRLTLDLAYTNLTDHCYLEEVKDQYEEMKTEYEDLTVVL